MYKIPVLGTQSLNSFSSLKRLILSIDYPVEVLSIVINNENFNFLKDVVSFCDTEIDKSLIEKVDVSFHPTNLGCPASWNYHFKSYPYADFFIKADDDICLRPNDLETIVREIKENKFEMVFYNHGTKYAFFGITKDTLKKVGLFDENIYPCNYEDDDYDHRRIRLDIRAKILNLETQHRSSTSMENLTTSEDRIKAKEYLNKTYEYYQKKWTGNFGDPMEYCKFNFDYRENKIFRSKEFT